MKGRIEQAFDRARNQGRRAFMPFIIGGFPDDDTFGQLLLTLDRAGADVIEVGIPFSDPLADGPVILTAGRLALEAGATPVSVLCTIARTAPELSAPVVVMTYYNPLFRNGADKFAQACTRAGVSGVIVPDLPPEEADQWIKAARLKNLDTIFMAAPTTTEERLEAILSLCSGFLYYVSLTGVTGAALDVDQDLLSALSRVRRASNLPVAAGFGVSTTEDARALGRACDGVIVGSAIVRLLLEAPDKEAGQEAVSRFTKAMWQSLAVPAAIS